MDVKRHVLGISTSEPIPADVMMDVKSYVHQAMDWYQLPAIYQLLHDSLISVTTRSAETTQRIYHLFCAANNAVSYAVVTLQLQDISTEMWEHFLTLSHIVSF